MILMITNMYPSKKYPNYGVFVENQYESMRKEFGTDIVALHKHVNKFVKLFAYIGYFISALSRILFGKYEVIYVNYASYNSIPMLIARFLGKRPKIITNLHGSDVISYSKLAGSLNFLTRSIVKKSDLVIVPSNFFHNLVREKYQVSDSVVSPSGGINPDLFYPIEDSEPSDKFEVGYVGRIDPEKGWEFVLRSIASLAHEIPSIHLTMIGSGVDDDKCLQMINQLQIQNRVQRISMLPQTKLAERYNCFSVFVFPGSDVGESLGLVGIEAMACGVPVIAGNLGGILSYIVDGENGMLFDRGSQGDLTAKIKEFHSFTDKKRMQMSIAGIRTAHHYETNEVTQNLVEIIKRRLSI